MRLTSWLWALFFVIALSNSAYSEEPLRKWVDAAGKFSIDASMVDVVGDSVRLLKQDGATIQVPLVKLSDADREYIKSRIAMDSNAENPFAVPSIDKPEPVSVNFSLRSVTPSKDVTELPMDGGVVVLLQKSSECEPLRADPAPPLPSLKAGQVLASPSADAYDAPSSIVTLNSRQALVAISLGRSLAGSAEPPTGKVFVGQLPKGPFS